MFYLTTHSIHPMTHRTMSEYSYHGATSRSSITPWANALTTELHLAPQNGRKEMFYLTTHSTHPTTHHTMSERSYHRATSRSTEWKEGRKEGNVLFNDTLNTSDDPSHHERTLLPRSYISLHRMEGRKCFI